MNNENSSIVQGPASLPAFNVVRRSRSAVAAHPADNGNKFQVFQLEQHCRNLEGELDHVKDEIIKIISDKSSASKENASLRHYVKAYEDLRLENQELKKELALLKLPISSKRKECPKSPKLSNGSNSPSSGSDSGSDHQDVKSIDRSSPDGQEYLESSSTTSSNNDDDDANSKGKDDEANANLNSMDLEVIKLKEEVEDVKARSAEEKQALETKVKDLEESLELMRGEFENMEDYWQVTKLISALSIFGRGRRALHVQKATAIRGAIMVMGGHSSYVASNDWSGIISALGVYLLLPQTVGQA